MKKTSILKKIELFTLTCALLLSGCGGSSQTANEGNKASDVVTEDTQESSTPAEAPTVEPDIDEASEPTQEAPVEETELYQSEQILPVSDETVLTLLFCGKEFPTGYGISQIEVKDGDTLLQTIFLADYITPEGDSLSEDGTEGYILTSVKEGLLLTQDMNFDGMTDLGLGILSDGAQTTYCVWLWDETAKQFVYGFQLQEPFADAENKRILCSRTDEAGNRVTDIYRYAEDQTFYHAGREVASVDADGKEHVDSYLVQNGELVPDFRVTPLNEVLYARSDANVRAGFSTDYEKLGRLSQNEEVQVTGRCENGWYQVLYQGKTAYIAATNLGKTPVAPKQPEAPKQQETPKQPEAPKQPEPQQETPKQPEAPKQPEPQQETPKQPEAPKQPEPQPVPQDGPYYMDDYAWSVLTIVNEKRAAEGLSALTMNETLISGAKVRAAEASQSFSHTRPDGSSCFTAFNVSYMTAGENIAAGQRSPEQVMNSWMNSAGHKANILNPDFTQIAIACYYVPGDAYGYYWVQLFIG